MATIPTEKEFLIRKVSAEIAIDIAEVFSKMSERELNNFRYSEIVEMWCDTFEDNHEWLISNIHLGMKKVKREFIAKVMDKAVNKYGR